MKGRVAEIAVGVCVVLLVSFLLMKGCEGAEKPGYVAPAYWSSFPQAKAAGWDKPSFVLIGIWQQDPLYLAWSTPNKDLGINTYIQLSGGSSLQVVRDSGMFAILPPSWAGPNVGPETIGWILGDEEDMWAGPGSDPWNGTTCVPAQNLGGQCGFTVLSLAKSKVPADGRLVYDGFGKGVLVWHGDVTSSQFINAYTNATGADLYWYSDNDSCIASQGGRMRLRGGLSASGPLTAGEPSLTASECHRASNYGLNIDRLRKLDMMDGKAQPIWSIVDVAVISAATPTALAGGKQLQGAVWSSFIHGANGINYFAHQLTPNFPCYGSVHILLDAIQDPRCGGQALRDAVKTVDAQVAALAPVLNSPAQDWDFGVKTVDTRLTVMPDGTAYVFAQQNTGTSTTAVLSLPASLAGASVTNILGTSSVSGTKLTMPFTAEYETRIVKLTPLAGNPPEPPPPLPPSTQICISIKVCGQQL